MEQFIGNWVIPNVSKVKFQGVLTVDEDTIQIDLVGDNEDFSNFFGLDKTRPQGDYHEIKLDSINGYAKSSLDNKDRAICLVKPYFVNWTQSDLIKITYRAKYLIHGIDIPSINNFKVQNVFVKYDLLDEWIGKYGFKINLSRDPKKFHVSIEFSPPSHIILHENSKYKMYLHFRAKSPWTNHKPKLTLSQSAFFNIEYKHKQKLENVKDLVYIIRDFFSFTSCTPIDIKNFEFKCHSSRVAKNDNRTNSLGILIDKSKVIKTVTNNYHHDFLIHYSDLEKSNVNVIEQWINKYEVLSPVMKMYLDNTYNKNQYLETEFLNYVQAIEVYHTRAINHKQIHLRIRLEELVNKYSKVVSQIIPNKLVFIDRVVNTRNYLTHYNVKIPKRKILKHQKMYDTSVRLKILLQAILLDEMGYDLKYIKKKVKNTLEGSYLYS